MRTALSIFLLAGLAGCQSTPIAAPANDPALVRGRVFVDRNANGVFDEGERGVRGVAVSDGEAVVRTDRRGAWSLPSRTRADYFVVKPTGYRVGVDENGLPRFYALHRPEGSRPELQYPGLDATGALPASLDFPLYEQEEPSPFRVLVVGDPQPRSIEEVDHFARDILPELAEADAAFGVSLGDIVHDDLDLYRPLVDAMGLLGLPWYHVFGNHDLNFDARDRDEAGATFERFFGPRTYAFEFANVHFIVLDDIDFRPASDEVPVGYRGGFSEGALRFVENYLADVDRAAQVVFLMHVPLAGDERNQVPQRKRLFQILRDRSNHWSISAHTHIQAHLFLGPESGNPGAVHHHWNSGTASGSWWSGWRDEAGIPHTTMRDGSPNGYSIVTFDGASYSIRFKAARRPADHQIAIHSPREVVAGSRHVIYANVFAGSERSEVDVRIHRAPHGEAAAGPPGLASDWRPMQRSVEVDPAFRALRRREADALAEGERALPIPNPSLHLWKRDLTFDLRPGSYWIEVRSRDMFGQIDVERQVIRVAAPNPTP